MNKKNIIISSLVVILVALSYLKVVPEKGAIYLVFNMLLIVAGFYMLILSFPYKYRAC